MRVFVLTTGRTASTTFAAACEHIDNMTAGHETRARQLSARLDYPDQHIEVDNRLVWFLGGLGRHFDDTETFYVHLTRDPQQVARSYLERWHINVSIVRHFYHGVLMRKEKPTPAEALDACHEFVTAVDDNISEFLSVRQNWCEVRLEHFAEDFLRFMTQAGLSGDREAMVSVLQQRQNTSKRREKPFKGLRGWATRFSSTKLDL